MNKEAKIVTQKIHQIGEPKGIWPFRKALYTVDATDRRGAVEQEVVSDPIRARNVVKARKIALDPNSNTIWRPRK